MVKYIAEPFTVLKGRVSDETLTTLHFMGLKKMTEIQANCIPKLLEGADVRGTAKTGSGKTLAFLIPVLEILRKLKFSQSQGTGAIIISPTRELSLQTFRVLKELSENHSLTHGIIMGGTDRAAEVQSLVRGVNILVATPGRLVDHMENTPDFKYDQVSILVVDEIDKILDSGFATEMTKILEYLPEQRQNILFSATKGSKVKKLPGLLFKNHLIDIDVDRDKTEATTDGLTQDYAVCPTEKRFLVLYSFIKRKKNRKTMIFFNSCNACKFYAMLLNMIGIPVTSLHGKQSQQRRTTTFNEFRNAKHGILMCTDVAARGWDIPAVDWIIQYDPPTDPKEYIHRVGRTARAGGHGNAMLILTEAEIGFVQYLKENKINVNSVNVAWNNVANIQTKVEDLLAENDVIYEFGKQAFKSYVLTYLTHTLRNIFDVRKIDLDKLGKSFGFDNPPYTSVYEMKESNNEKIKKEIKSLKRRRGKQYFHR